MRTTLLLLLLLTALGLATGCRTGTRHAVRRAAPARPPAAAHPLDPLTAGEIERAARVLQATKEYGDAPFFPLLVLHEPTKEQVARHAVGGALPRKAFAIVLDRPAQRTFEVVIDLSGEGRVESSTLVPDVQPNLIDEEYGRVEDLIRADARWQDALRRRGITDFEQVKIDVWAPGVPTVPGVEPGTRLARGIAFHKPGAGSYYARPIEGVVGVVDLTRGIVVDVVDTGVRPIPAGDADVAGAADATPPAGVGGSARRRGNLALDGQEVRWNGWVFRFDLHPREGLVLHRVGYEQDGVVRSILHRASVSEIAVPYGDPDGNWYWRNAFDEGEYGLGRLSHPLAPGVDVPADAVLRDVTLADERGEPYVLARGVGFFERDTGVLWTHYDEEAGRSVARRGRELVLTHAVTIGNYDYGISWVFRQDGAIQAEVMASGILLAKGSAATGCRACRDLAQGRDPSAAQDDEATGTLVDRHVVAPNHQHFVCFRLDLDVDGEKNSVAEMDVGSLPAGEGNPHGNGFAARPTLLASEKQAVRDLSPDRHRTWKVFNPAKPNDLGHLPGYALLPGEGGRPYALPDAPTRARSGFTEHPVWVTRLRAGELSAAGPYPNQRADQDGLPRWIQDDEPLVNEDVVLWHTLCLTHVPRPEEWPIMAAATLKFTLVPFGFFRRSPALDVPRAR
jgi:primary-amine oxidase